jgi:SHS2 domain-containing protein
VNTNASYAVIRNRNDFKTRFFITSVAEVMEDKRRFDFLEHTADAYIAAYGKNLSEAFENAARAMFQVMTEVEEVSPEVKDHVEVEAEDEYALLYSWLEALLVRFDACGMLYSKFKVLVSEQSADGFALEAEIWGEKFDPERHSQKVGVKAVTYHRMEIIKEPTMVTLKFILDI